MKDLNAVKTKNEIIKGLHLGMAALDKTQSIQNEIIFAQKQIREAIKYLEVRKDK